MFSLIYNQSYMLSYRNISFLLFPGRLTHESYRYVYGSIMYMRYHSTGFTYEIMHLSELSNVIPWLSIHTVSIYCQDTEPISLRPLLRKFPPTSHLMVLISQKSDICPRLIHREYGSLGRFPKCLISLTSLQVINYAMHLQKFQSQNY